MKAVRYHIPTGNFEVISDAPVPVPEGNDVLVRCRAVALNPVDAKVGNWKGIHSPIY
jgi:NADPH:quinone reductase-like Zn-dependent oxidoreductase